MLFEFYFATACVRVKNPLYGTTAKFQQLLLQYNHACNTVHLNAVFLSTNILIELLFLHDNSIRNGQARDMLKLPKQKTSDMKRAQNYN